MRPLACLSFLHLPAFLALLALSPATAKAEESSWPPRNPLCREARLATLHVKGAKDLAESQDLCALSAEEISAPFQEAIRDAREVHERVAAAFRLNPEELFPQGVRLTLKASGEGLNGAYEPWPARVEVGAVPHPTRWLNQAVYAHELGHWVADSDNPRVSSVIKETRLSFLMGETLADTVALAAFGNTGSADPDLPACTMPRQIDGNQGYKAPVSFFEKSYGLRGIRVCCAQNQGRLSENGKLVCAAAEIDPQGKQRPPVTPFRKQLFRASQAVLNRDEFDSHQIGVPLNSFLFALGEKAGRPLFADFLAAAGKASGHPFRCGLYGDERGKGPITLTLTPLRAQLRTFQASLEPGLRKEWASLWTKHGLDSALEIDEQELATKAEELGLEEIYRAMRANRSAFLNRSHACYAGIEKVMLGKAEELPEECEVGCMPLRRSGKR